MRSATQIQVMEGNIGQKYIHLDGMSITVTMPLINVDYILIYTCDVSPSSMYINAKYPIVNNSIEDQECRKYIIAFILCLLQNDKLL
jgi:hypothetical protein